MKSRKYIENPKTKAEKHNNYVVWLIDCIENIELKKKELDEKLTELKETLEINKDFIPEED